MAAHLIEGKPRKNVQMIPIGLNEYFPEKIIHYVMEMVFKIYRFEFNFLSMEEQIIACLAGLELHLASRGLPITEALLSDISHFLGLNLNKDLLNHHRILLSQKFNFFLNKPLSIH